MTDRYEYRGGPPPWIADDVAERDLSMADAVDRLNDMADHIAELDAERLELAQDVQHIFCKSGPLFGALADLGGVEVPDEIGAMMVVAAEQIERLAAERDRYRAALEWLRDNAVAEGDRERARAALDEAAR